MLGLLVDHQELVGLVERFTWELLFEFLEWYDLNFLHKFLITNNMTYV